MINNKQYPDKSLYITGGNVLSILSSNIHGSMSVSYLFDVYEKNYQAVSYPYFIYSLDWLFIISAIDLNENGDLILCK